MYHTSLNPRGENYWSRTQQIQTLSSTIPISIVLPYEDERVTFLDKTASSLCSEKCVSRCCVLIVKVHRVVGSVPV